jgi:hypothetical protein
LGCTVTQESRLEPFGMARMIFKSLYSDNVATLNLTHGCQAGTDRLAIQKDRASSTIAGVAPDLSSRLA